MGRSTRSQAQENRARIVDAAAGLFRRHGVDAVSIADVMTAAGMTQGGFYKHFPSKEALAAEACATAFARSVEAWKEQARQSADGGQAALRDLLAYYFSEKPPERTCPMVALARDAAAEGQDQPLHLAYGDGTRRLFEAFAAVAGEGRKAPQRRAQIMTLFAAMVGANLLARAVGDEPWIREMKTVLLDAVVPAVAQRR